jgi:hypothetical protein
MLWACPVMVAWPRFLLRRIIMTHTTLLPPSQWAEEEFALAELGDPRRTKRLVKMASALAHSPGGTLPQAFPEWKELKGAYRLLSQPEASYERILSPHWEHTRQACQEAGEYLFIEDTTELDYTDHPATQELGFIGDGRGRGLLLHSTLAVRVEACPLEEPLAGTVLGLLGQQCWGRQGAPGKKRRETWRQRVSRPRESQRWARVLEEVGGPPRGCRWIFMADREADFYEPIERCQRHGLDFIIRGYRDRALVDKTEHLKAAVRQAPVRGQMRVKLRARPGQAARTAVVEVRTGRVQAQGPERRGGPRPALRLQVVEVREVGAPAGVEALHWLLLSSLPCTSWGQVQRIVRRYAARWWVEEYHKALKTGVGVEASQLERAYRLESLVAVLAVVAVRLLNAKWLARAHPDEAVEAAVFGEEALGILAGKYGRPAGGWTHRSVLVAVARLGGFLARRHDGLPGWQTIWRGWQRLLWMCQGVELLQQQGGTCG